jgi:hypothetical protein
VEGDSGAGFVVPSAPWWVLVDHSDTILALSGDLCFVLLSSPCSSESEEYGSVTLAATAPFDGCGMLFRGVDWLIPLYCRQVLITASRAAVLITAVLRCSFTSADSPATDSSSSSLKLDGSQLAKVRSVKSLSRTRSMANAAMLSTKVSRAILNVVSSVQRRHVSPRTYLVVRFRTV